MTKRIHKTEYHYLKMPFLFDMACSDKRVYTVSMMFFYQYPVKVKGAVRPSVLACKAEACRMHYFVTRAFLSYLKEYPYLDFPIEWQKYFSPKVKMPKERPFPYASDEKVKEYISGTLSNSLKVYITREEGLQKERLDYLFSDLKIMDWMFLIDSCTPHKRLQTLPKDKIVRLYTNLHTYVKE